VLVDHLEDRRLTRATGDRDTQVVLVQDLVLDCVEQIAGGTFRTNHEVSGKFSVLPPAERKAIAAQVRRWMANYAMKPQALAKLALVESKPVASRLFVLQDLEHRYPGVVDAVAYLKRWALDAKLEDMLPVGGRQRIAQRTAPTARSAGSRQGWLRLGAHTASAGLSSCAREPTRASRQPAVAI
jgi:hypothetical protein